MKKFALRDFLIAICSVFFLINSALIFLIFFPIQQKQKVPEIEYPELPRLYITLNGTTLDEINSNGKENRFPGNEITFLVDKEYYDFSNVEIKGRGNSTWIDGEKKPYQIKFDSKENLFGLGKAKSWVLLANHFDDAFLRNDLAFYVARLLEIEFTNNGRFVELYVDNEYIGLYYLTQKIGINRASVDIKDEDAVLMEMDNIYYDEYQKKYISKNGDVFVLKDSVSDDPEKQDLIASDFIRTYSDFENAVAEKNWQKIQELVDVESFAKFYIMQDFSLNWDAFTTSQFYYKDGANDKIHAGPAWDFDNSFGRWLETAFYRRDLEYNSNGISNQQSDTFFELAKIQEFRELVSEIVQQKLLPNSEKILSYVDEVAAKLDSAAKSDIEKWEKTDFYEGVQKTKETLQRRLDYYAIFYANEETDFNGYYLFKNLNLNFQILPLDGGGYKIIRMSDNRALTVDESYNEYGTVSFHSFKDSVWQKWYICRDNEGRYYLFSVATESVLAINEFGQLITKPLTRSENEQFEIAEIGTFPLDTIKQEN